MKLVCKGIKGDLSFLVNGDDLGVAYYDVDCDNYLTVYLDMEGDVLTIL